MCIGAINSSLAYRYIRVILNAGPGETIIDNTAIAEGDLSLLFDSLENLNLISALR